MNHYTKPFFISCQQMGLKPIPKSELEAFKIDIGNQIYYFQSGHVPDNSYVSVEITGNKYTMNKLMKLAGVPVPKAWLLEKGQDQKNEATIKDMNFPVVAKANWHASCGMGVVCNLQSPLMLNIYLDKYFHEYDTICVEEYKPDLKSYRLLVVGQKVVAAVERFVPEVIGDGVSTIHQLIVKRNDTFDAAPQEYDMFPIVVNDETFLIFNDLKVDLQTIPVKGERIPLRYACNKAVGGTTLSFPEDKIEPSNAKLAVLAAKSVGLRYAGVDVLCEDITKPISKTRGYILEVNSNPNITFHEVNPEGVCNQVSKKYIQYFMKKKLVAYTLKQILKIGMMLVVIGSIITAVLIAYSYFI